MSAYPFMLSPHFSFAEGTESDTAQRLQIPNLPDDEQLDNMEYAASQLEAVRELLGYPLTVTSWLRQPALNKAVGGASNSDHMKGVAIDFKCPQFGTPLMIVKAIAASDIQFDQCIQEGTWCHISFGGLNRREVLTAHFGATGTTYTSGV